jgi:hypothetical protein
MATGIEEDVNLVRPVSGENDGFFTHLRHEEVTGFADLAFVPDKKPGAPENLLDLAAVDLGVHENLAADFAMFGIDQAFRRMKTGIHYVAPEPA